MSTDYKRIRDYELMVIFHPELSEEDLVSEGGKVEEHITGVSGTISLVNREAPWGRRRLAYPIRHGGRDIRDGVYVLYYFSAESGHIEEIEREIKLQDRIIRYLLTQQTVPTMEPAPAEGEGEEGGEAEVASAPGADSTASGAPVEGAPAETAATTDATNDSTEAAPVESDTTSDSAEAAPAEADATTETPA
jgi:small subunit ribosomal protein S6